MNIILASRLNYLLKQLGYDKKFSTIFYSHMGGMIVGDITPGRGGYFLTPSILKKSLGIKITDGMVCIFAPQGLEFVLKVGGASVAILYISTIQNVNNDILISSGIGAGALLIVGILMLVFSWKNENLSLKALQNIPFFKNFTENVSSFKTKSIGIKDNIKAILLFSLLGWVFAAFHWFYLGQALGIELSYFEFFLLHPLLTILMFVPISPAGLGLLEGGVILVFLVFGIPTGQAMAFSVILRLSILIVDLIGLKSVMSSIKDLKL